MNRHEKIAFLAQKIGPLFLKKEWQIALAESCSGGGLAYHITKCPGSSAWLKYSVVTYTDEAKQQILGVSPTILAKFSAVSDVCAKAMLEGLDDCCARVAITGYTGPSGADVGHVYIAYAAPHEIAQVISFHFLGSREDIQEQAIFEALKLLLEMAWVWQNDLKHDCFFALNIDNEQTQRRICEQAIKLGFSNLNLEPMTNFHLTLAYFSNQNQPDIISLIQKGEDTYRMSSSFIVFLNKLQYFDRADAWVLELEQEPLALKQLAGALGAKDFLPHLTISKRCKLNHDLEYPSFSIPWEVQSFSLFLSFHGLFYIPIKTWNLET